MIDCCLKAATIFQINETPLVGVHAYTINVKVLKHWQFAGHQDEIIRDMAISRLSWRQVWVLYVYAIQGCTHITQFVLLVNIAAKYVRWCGTVACIHLDVTIKLLMPEVRDCPCATKRPLRRDWGSCILHVYGCVLQHDWYTERKWLHMGLQNTNVTLCKDKIFWNLSKMFIVKNMKYQGPNAKFDSY